jgi:cryptochrome
MPGARVLYWFRMDLRLHDNPALQVALSLNPEVLWPIWCFDPYFVYHVVRVAPNRWQFLCVPAMWRLIDRLDSQRDVNERLTKLNNKSKLFVVRGDPVTVLPDLFAEW